MKIDYNEYLLDQLLALRTKEILELEYDLRFEGIRSRYEEFRLSKFNDQNKGVYECMAEYLNDKYPINVENNELWLHVAHEYLCGYDDGDVASMVKAIFENDNPHELIDYVELPNGGTVCVWEKVEFEFTCAEFLKIINYSNN